ncbi:DGQHR domain-containing protein [Marinobacter sp. 1Y8]
MDNSSVYFEGNALKVEQPLGTFYVISISAEQLLKVCYSDKAKMAGDGLNISGTQRKEDELRQKEISNYIVTHEAAFPNSIILGANYTEDGELVEDEERQWKVRETDTGSFILTIPSSEELASIIDGQHRLKSFRYADDKVKKNFQLLCSIYLDLPVPYHAYLFSTINFNQKKVDRSLAYNLFGFDIDASDSDKWVPETLAVSLARRLNVAETPFKNAIVLGVIGASTSHESMKISMATVVDGLLRLFSKKPKQDRSEMMKVDRDSRSRKNLSDDGSPLRFLYIGGYDEVIFEVVVNYFSVVNDIFWSGANEGSYINKTVGVQALFDVLEKLLKGFEDRLDGSEKDFREKLGAAAEASLDFAGAQASGIGRTHIRNQILDKLKSFDDQSGRV